MLSTHSLMCNTDMQYGQLRIKILRVAVQTVKHADC